MKKLTKLLALLLLICTLISSMASCDLLGGLLGGEIKLVDYAGQVQLDMSSETAKQEVTVKSYIDGDTTHFYLSEKIDGRTVLKGRYIAINTPESTGKIEEWGKKASNFTKSKLKEAESIIIESDTGAWTADSTGDRFLVWVWYKLPGQENYRNLNIEILQEGLAIASNSNQNRYGDVCMQAISQAKAAKLHVYSKNQDPDFYYGGIIEVTLDELRANIESYKDALVAFTAIVTRDDSNGVYVEAYNEETGMYSGIYVYYGFNLSGTGLGILSEGNEVRIVGTVNYYETGDSWQISGLQYRDFKPSDPKNIQKLSDGHTPAYVETTAETFTSKVKREVIVDGEETLVDFDYAQLCLGTSISMRNLKVVDMYTTTNEESASKGAITLTCRVGNVEIDVRTNVLYDANGDLITEEYYENATIDVTGIIDEYNGGYQIKVFSLKDIVLH